MGFRGLLTTFLANVGQPAFGYNGNTSRETTSQVDRQSVIRALSLLALMLRELMTSNGYIRMQDHEYSRSSITSTVVPRALDSYQPKSPVFNRNDFIRFLRWSVCVSILQLGTRKESEYLSGKCLHNPEYKQRGRGHCRSTHHGSSDRTVRISGSSFPECWRKTWA